MKNQGKKSVIDKADSEKDVKILNKNGPIHRVYNERKDFILIGLTGRTGSGCSTVARILGSEFDKLDLHTPKTSSFETKDERKYAVIHKYAKINWKNNTFFVIKVTDIITSFVLESGYKDFIAFVKSKNNDNDLLNEISSLESQFSDLEIKVKEIQYDDEQNYKLIIELYSDLIPKFTESLKAILVKYNCDPKTKSNKMNPQRAQLYTHLFQIFGANIRASGNPYNGEFNCENIFIIANRVNKFVKAIRKQNKEKSLPTLICIDAIRNRYEATFFQDRYSSFYLYAISTDDKTRKERLTYLNKYEIEDLDDTEYTKGRQPRESFYVQNIKSCIEIADIHIYNPSNKENTLYKLTEQIVKYVTLIMHPGLVTPTHIERCMQMAYNAKLNSGCLSRQVGASITDSNYSLKAIGWNSVPECQIECNLRDIKNLVTDKDSNTYSLYEISNNDFLNLIKNETINYENLEGRFHPYCFKDYYNKLKDEKNQVHTRSLHAEENAFLQIVKYGGEGIKGGFLFTTASPCELCSKKAFQLGIEEIYYIDPYPGISEEHILNFGKDKKPKLSLFQGAIGRAYTLLYNQRISFKDELALMNSIDF
ncbi:MAG: dCMP deaminase [Oscillospiraceae bacterium]|nr:dCMP deaminase [Oscillospiraceae bacterium]